MSAKHTPGPWVYDGGDQNGGGVSTADDKEQICDFGDWGGIISASNGKLIAAAPALAEALEAYRYAAAQWPISDPETLKADELANAALRVAGRLE